MAEAIVPARKSRHNDMSAVAQHSWAAEQLAGDLSILFASAPIGIGRCLPSGMIVPLNTGMERVLGDFPTSGSYLLPCLVPDQSRARCEKLLGEIAGGIRDSFRIESPIGDHAIQWMVWRPGSGMPDALAVAYATPVPTQTEEQPKHSRLETAGRLVSSVAHDFNNWLTGILLYSDLLLSAIDSSHPAHKYAEEIRAAGVHATGFVRQLLSFTKPTPCQPQVLSMNDIIEGMHNVLSRLVGENIRLDLHLDARIGLVRIDPTQAQQIVLNLTLNARDAMPQGGRIVLGTSSCKIEALGGNTRTFLPCVLFAVEDTGTGIDPHVRPHIFEPFFTTKDGKGTGLGLSTVQEIVTKNGGLVHVESEPGHGTRVSVLLPAVSEQSAGSRSDFYSPNGEVSSSTKEESLP